MKIEKIKGMSVAELKKQYTEKKIKLNAYQLDLKSGKEKDTAKVKTMRREIARILTVINYKTVAGEITEAVAVKEESKPAKEEKADKAEKTTK